MTLPSGVTSLPFADWLSRQRWYAGRNRVIWNAEPSAVTRLPHDIDHVLLDVSYADGGTERYQVLVGWDRDLLPELVAAATIGVHDGHTACDALFDETAARQLLALVDQGTDVGRLRFVPEPGRFLRTDLPARVVEAEQSNTSVVFDSEAILKVFRRVLPGANPDLELNRALARAECPHAARLLGAVESTDDNGEPLSLGMITAFAQNSAEGWAMATASARDLLNELSDVDEAGGDFGAESYRLGEAVATVHRTLAEELGTIDALAPTAAMVERLEAAAGTVPELTDHVPALRARLEEAGSHPVRMHRVHGDLHLGQVLRTPDTWLLIDFEGEPGQPMAARRRPDSPLRDVAGMLRSYEYAAQQLLIGVPEDERLAGRARDWVDRNRAAFCDGYAAAAGSDPRAEPALLCAYELDKAVYEAAYERRHRPDWLSIPLRSIAGLAGAAA